jgi:hypothetical protein
MTHYRKFIGGKFVGWVSEARNPPLLLMRAGYGEQFFQRAISTDRDSSEPLLKFAGVNHTSLLVVSHSECNQLYPDLISATTLPGRSVSCWVT